MKHFIILNFIFSRFLVIFLVSESRWQRNCPIFSAPSAFDHTFGRHCLTYHLSENNAIKHLIIKHNNSTNQITSSDLRKILTDNTIIIY